MTSASAPFRPRRDRHGRGQRGPMAWPPVPAMATRAERFDELVLDAAGRMEHHAGSAMGDLEFAVEDVPPSDPAPWESSDVPLGRLFAAPVSYTHLRAHETVLDLVCRLLLEKK